MRSASVKKMFTMLVSMIMAGTAPGQQMLCVSRLIALEKPDNGVRPIAVGELVYRLCTKVILRHSFNSDYLASFHFGVGTRGGVEPVIRAAQRLVDNTITSDNFTHLISLDFKNAFNTLDRKGMAQAVKTYAPGLYRMGKWAYNDPAKLVMGGIHGDATVIMSSQGVRQGDPLGPLFFSIGIRPVLEELKTVLGPESVVMAYLDDVYVLSKSERTLDTIEDFFREQQSSLQLNEEKSYITSVEEIRARGLKILGSCIGPKFAREDFLEEKIVKAEEKLSKLIDLPHQHALLLLRNCLQQDLRHLQRCLQSDDLALLWERLDKAIWQVALRIRGSTSDAEPSDIDFALLSLPVRKGGLGLLSHQECAPLAYGAASDASDHLLEPLLGPPPQPPELSDRDNEDSITPQRVRCEKAFELKKEALFSNLNDHQIKTIIESASGFGRKWLGIIPFYQALRLSDFEVSSALHLRTLHPGPTMVCPLCGIINSPGHAEVCQKRKKWNIARHEQVKRAIATALNQVEGVRVEVEPHIGETRRRNDIRVTGSEVSGLANHEYDVTVVSLATEDAVNTFLPPSLLPTTPAERAHALITKFLTSKADEKKRRMPASNIAFSPLVFTVGGLMDAGTTNCLKLWQASVPPSAFSHLCQQLSLILLRARTKSFVL